MTRAPGSERGNGTVAGEFSRRMRARRGVIATQYRLLQRARNINHSASASAKQEEK